MPVESHSDPSDPTIIHMNFVGIWSWLEYHEANRISVSIANSTSKPVCAILDMRQSEAIPLEDAKEHITAARNIQPSNMDITVIVGPDEILTALIDFMTALYGRHYHPRHLANTREEAYAIIEKHRKKTTT